MSNINIDRLLDHEFKVGEMINVHDTTSNLKSVQVVEIILREGLVADLMCVSYLSEFRHSVPFKVSVDKCFKIIGENQGYV